MKDFKNYLALGVLSLFLSACTSDNIPDNSGQITFEGDGYLAIDIKLPTQSGTTRANDIYDDGLVQEYDVKDGCLLIFKGTDEMTAEFQAAYQLPSFNGNNEDSGTVNDNITTSYKKAVKVEDISLTDTENLYGLVMLNYRTLQLLLTRKSPSTGRISQALIVRSSIKSLNQPKMPVREANLQKGISIPRIQME